jgi:hypothetical protein
LATDGIGGAVFCWQDERVAEDDIYIQHVSESGHPDPNLPQDGAPICAAAGSQSAPTVGLAAPGVAIAAWEDGRQNQGCTPPDVCGWAVYGQQFTFTPSSGVPPGAPRVAFTLDQNQPNPFSGSTIIRFELAHATPARLEVFDPLGRRIRTLALGSFAAGYHSVEWDQRDAAGNHVRPGVYLYQLSAGAYRAQRKMVLLPD